MIRRTYEGVAFFLVIIIMFNMLTQFLQTLGLFKPEDVTYVGMIAVLLGLNNLLTRKFFGYRIFNSQ